MSYGSFTIEAPHICGERVHVQINWSVTPGRMYMPNGDPGYPDDYDEEWLYSDHDGSQLERCPKCNVVLDWDDLFMATVQRIRDNTTDQGEDPGEPDYEPDYPYEEPPDWANEEWDQKY